MKRISFDFDQTLSELHIQEIAKAFMAIGYEVWIVTARTFSNEFNTNQDVYRVAKSLNIPESRIVFTNGSLKWTTLENLQVDMHFDDMPDEVNMIEIKTNIKAILVWNDGTLADIKNNW